jgi:cobalt transporter subunit CbtA
MVAATFRRVFLSAAGAGLLAGLLVSVVQLATTTPLILHAEKYEKAGTMAAIAQHPPGVAHADAAGAASNAGHGHGDGWMPGDGLERTAYTALANIVTGFGFALLLCGCFALARERVDAARGVLWGIAGFAVFALAPALGLPAELPGTEAAALGDRQGWWLLAVTATALGLWLVVRCAQPIVRALGVLVLILPHALGAPRPPALSAAVPPELAAHFAAASIVTAAVFWVLLGWFCGAAYRRLG